MEELLNSNDLIAPILGGIIIGLACLGLMAFNGRIAGISGIIKGALRFQKGDFIWRVSFIAGMIGMGFALLYFYSDYAEFDIDRSIISYGVAGLLIGLGTGISNGCTSGHGVCGIGRLSNRSVTATMAFTFAGIVTVWAINTFFGGSL